MVSTRSQRGRLVAPNPRIGMRQPFRKRYRPNDHAKRHRLPDRRPKTQHVISYNRRT